MSATNVPLSSSGLLEGWTDAKLEGIAEQIQYGYTSSAAKGETGPRFLRITDIQEGKVDWNTVPTCQISREDLEKYSLGLGDIVFARTGATTGKSYLIRSCPRDAVFASYLIRLRLRSGIEPGFVNLFFNTRGYWEYISDNVAGNAQPNCNATKLGALLVPLAPLAEQKRIVEKVEQLLCRVNAVRERLARVSAILKRFRQAVLAAACSGRLTDDWRESNSSSFESKQALKEMIARRKVLWLGRERVRRGRNSNHVLENRYKPPFDPSEEILADLPDTWAPATVSQVALLDVGFAFRSSEFSSDGLRLLRGENIEPGTLRWQDTKHWPVSKLKGFEYLLVEEGEIILALDRPLVSSGLKIARAKQIDVPCLLVQRVMRFKLPEPKFAPFLFLCLQRHEFVSHLSNGLTGSDLPHVTGTTVAEYTFGFPPPAEQIEIVRRVEALFKLADAIEKRVSGSTERAEKLTQAILAKAFRGELVPTEAELARREGRSYESAAALLDRLRASQLASTSASTDVNGVRRGRRKRA
jgi:type I restriction enzyme S subunit